MKSLFLIVILGTTGVLARSFGNGTGIGSRIVGGYETSISKVPFQAAVLYNGWLLCGGSILSCKYILTAGHCFFEFNDPSLTTVRLGSSEHADGGSIHEVGRIDVHPKYDNFLYDYDVSILTLRTIVKFDAYKQPIVLPYLNEALPAGSFVSLTGWGFTLNTNESNAILRMVELKVVNQFDCYRIYGGGITTRMFCAGGFKKDACNGDSGGPVVDMRSKKQVGIISFGPRDGCAIEGTPGGYTRIASVRQWIRQIIKF